MLIEALISRGLRMLHDRVEEEIISCGVVDLACGPGVSRFAPRFDGFWQAVAVFFENGRELSKIETHAIAPLQEVFSLKHLCEGVCRGDAWTD